MNALFLGTCACDYSPKLKTEFADTFDFDARRSSAFLLNGRYLIDCGDTCYTIEARFTFEMYEGLFSIMYACFETFRLV